MNTWTKRMSILLAVTIVLTLGVGVASAQEPPREGERAIGAAALINALAELAEVQPRELLANAEPGITLNDIAAESGIASEDVVALAAASLTERINQAVENGRLSQDDADATLATLEADLATLMSTPLPERSSPVNADRIREQGLAALLQALSDATGKDLQTLRQEAADAGLETLAAIAEANGVNPDDVVAAAMTAATERTDAAVAEGRLTEDQAAELLAALETGFAEAMTRPLPAPSAAGRPNLVEMGARELLNEIMNQTGLDMRALMEQLRDGATPAEVLEANGVNPDDVIAAVMARAEEAAAQAVDNGRITEEQAAELLTNAEERLTNALNNPLPERAPNAAAPTSANPGGSS